MTQPDPQTPPDDGPAAQEATPPSSGGTTPEEQRQTFDREYVEQLRRENATQRVKGKRADSLAARLVTSYADATGRLADASDLPYSDDLLDDDGLVDRAKVEAAVAELLERKPHLASRRPSGDVGQGARPAEAEQVSLAGLLRAGAG